MFIKWGVHDEIKDLGPCGVRNCRCCNTDSEFDAKLSYRVRHLYWIFRWVTDRQRSAACRNCGYVYPAEKGLGPEAERAAIPFIDRRGWTIGVGALAGLIALVVVAVVSEGREDRAFLAAPHVGDVYEVNTAKLMTEPEMPRMYSAMRVVEVQGADIILELGKTYFEDLRGVQDDLREGRTRNADYYMEEKLVFSRVDLKGLYEDGTISNVER